MCLLGGGEVTIARNRVVATSDNEEPEEMLHGSKISHINVYKFLIYYIKH
jgi:hypothetical protein